MDKSSLLLKIEQCRIDMYSLAQKHGLSSNEVIRASRRLDCLLNEYRTHKKTTNDKSYLT
ncbi:MAG TPA: aspartyl-phosphate phosphatase Spo0E family protein [Bacillota bacterium]|nr:aspartyl-phosphate phosphatase Spo0E family protein [Bacillota bacterium]